MVYVLAAENLEEAEEWVGALRPAARLKGRVLALTSVASAERIYAQLQASRRQQDMKRRSAERARKMAEQKALLARLDQGEEGEDSMQQYRDGVSFGDRWDEVHATLKDLGRSVMEGASPDKVLALSQTLGHGLDSDSDEGADSVQRDDQDAAVPAAPAPSQRLSRYTIKQATVCIQSWARGILERCSLRTRRASIMRMAEQVREKQLRALGGYCTKQRRWERFLPVTAQMPSQCASRSLPLHGSLLSHRPAHNASRSPSLTPPWAKRYEIPEPLALDSSNAPAHRATPATSPSSFLPHTPDNARRPRRLFPSPTSVPDSTPTHLPPALHAAVGQGACVNGERQPMDPAARQLQRDIKLKKTVLKMRTVELIKELRTRALDTSGSKYLLTARLEEYLDKAIRCCVCVCVCVCDAHRCIYRVCIVRAVKWQWRPSAPV